MIIVRKNKFLVLSLMQLVYIFYFTLTTLIFFISFNSGYEGVTIRIFGGGDDGFLYWDLAQSIARGFSRKFKYITLYNGINRITM